MAREQRVEGRRQAEDIAPWVARRRAEPDQLGGAPGAGRRDKVGGVLLRLFVCNEGAGEPGHPEAARVGDDDALGRDASMEDAARVRGGEEVCHHVAQIGHRRARQSRATFCDHRSTMRAANQLDHHKRVALAGHILAQILERCRMGDLLRDGGIAEEAPAHPRVACMPAVEHLHGHLRTAPVSTEVDTCRAPLADERVEPVGVEHRPEARVNRRFAALRGLPAGAEPVWSRLHHQLPPNAQSSLRASKGSTKSHRGASPDLTQRR